MPTARVLDLSFLTPWQGFVIQGDQPGDYAGHSVSSAGDVNGDGIDDLIVGAPADWWWDDAADAGDAYVIFGKTGATRNRIDLSDFSATDGFAIHGHEPFFRTGLSVSSAGDVNGDGIDDLIVAAPYSDIEEQYSGAVFCDLWQGRHEAGRHRSLHLSGHRRLCRPRRRI